MNCARNRLTGTYLVICILLGGCSLVEDFNTRKRVEEPSATDTARETTLVGEYLKTLEVLSTAAPSEQAELAEHARAVAATDPTIFHRLQYALVLAMPGHPATDPKAARDALDALLATPEMLLPAEVAIARVMRLEADARIVLESENQRLAAAAARSEQGQVDALTRRAQSQAVEITRLKHDLAEALAKLEAVATLERDIAERREGKERTP